MNGIGVWKVAFSYRLDKALLYRGGRGFGMENWQRLGLVIGVISHSASAL